MEEKNTKLPETSEESPTNQEVKETVDPLDKEIGDKEQKKLEPKDVKVLDVSIQDQFKKGETTNPVGKMAVFMCQHPDKTDLIRISKSKYFKTEDKLAESGLWYNEDEDGLIVKGSALAKMMIHYEKETLNQFIGKDLKTVCNAEGYLLIKSY